MKLSRSKFCEGPDVRADDPLPIHLRHYTMLSSEDPTGWNVGIADGGIGKASASVGGIFHLKILGVLVCFHCSSQIQCTTQSSAYVTRLIVELRKKVP